MSISCEAPSSGGPKEASSATAWGKERPLPVPELPPSLDGRGNMASVDTIVSEQERPVAFYAESGHESPSISMNRWPRGGPRNAVSRVGYISDDAEDEGDAATAQQGPPGASSALVQEAPPPLIGHVRPRLKPAESPREALPSTAAVKLRPAALSRMASRQESLGRASSSRFRAPSQQDVAGHVSADLVGGDFHAQAFERGPPKRAASTDDQGRSSLEAFERTRSPPKQLGRADPRRRGSSEARGARGASDSHSAGVADERNAEDGRGSKQQPTQDRDLRVADQRISSRASPPSRADQVRRSFAEAFADESERRAAALASRSSSRPISRVEGQVDQRQLAQRANVAAAAAEQLRRMTPPQEKDVSDSASVQDSKQLQNGFTRSSVTLFVALYQEAGSGIRADPVEPQADHLGLSPASASPGSRPRTPTQSDRSPVKAVEDLPEQLPTPTPPTAPPRDASTTPAAATEAAASQRLPPPQSLQGTQKEIKVMLEVEEQRRAAVTASRARSRIVSRAEGSVDPASLAARSDVTKAAAEQLRRLAEQRRASGSHQAAAPTNGCQAKRHAAATKIQAVWRGHRIRLWVNAARVIARFTKFVLPSTKMSPSKLRQPRVLRPRCNMRTAGC
ncbi:hypothetical protein ACSSS7_006657 [Eimeria intestinalis]